MSYFKAHGYYSWSNTCSCEVELSNDGESARLHFPDSGQVSDWLPIEWVKNEDSENEDDDIHPVIDYEGHNIPLSLVMRF